MPLKQLTAWGIAGRQAPISIEAGPLTAKKMSLRKQLALIAVLILLLPIAALRFAVELEQSLRAAQDSSHLELSRFVSEALSSELSRLPEANNALTLSPMQQHFALDGYLNDWSDIPWLVPENSANHIRLKLGSTDNHLAIVIELTDSSVEFQSPGSLSKPYDEIILALYSNSGKFQTATDTLSQTYRIFNDGPGPLQKSEGKNLYLNGVWQTTPTGSVIELSVTLPPTGIGAIRLDWLDIDRKQEGLFSKHLQPILGSADQPSPIIYLDSVTSGLASRLTPENTRLSIFSRQNQLLFQHDRQLDRINTDNEHIWRVLIRKLLLGSQPDDSAEQPDLASQTSPFTQWQRAEQSGTAVLTSYYPVVRIGQPQSLKPAAWISLARQTTAVAALADAAVFQVLSWLSLVTLIIVIALFSYASWLSWRIRLLKKQIVTVMNPDQRFQASFDSSKIADELGDLSRAFAGIVGHLRAYSDYMESFAGKLTHECRTPLAIVTSSLQLLANASNASEQQAYLQRALEGASRISSLLTCMRQATQLESSIRQQNLQPIDLVQLVEELAAAYKDLYSKHRVIAEISCTSALISGNADLLAQAMDKLLDNARDFTPQDGQITLGLSHHSGRTRVWVENQGKPIPEPLLGQLFQPFISQRESYDHAADDALHLGMGLVVVKLIADYHQAKICVENIAITEPGNNSPGNEVTKEGHALSAEAGLNRTRFTLIF